ncbi:MAG: P44/Msp2 family outer membrane protein [Pseudomonadota bacterium]
MLNRPFVSVAAGAAAILGAAQAQDTYVSFSGGGSFLQDSANNGFFTEEFITGPGTTIPAGTALPQGADVSFDTEFNTGWTINGAVGWDFGWLRSEFEVAYQSNGIDSHSGVTAAGIPLDNEDVGVLITGLDTNLGATVGEIVAAGEGEVDTLFVMVNAIGEWENSTAFTPYIGAGVGAGFVDVNYAPSGTEIINDEDVAFAYQFMAGVGYELTSSTTLFAGYRYRATLDPEVNASLFAAEFDTENAGSIVEAGVRFTF